MASRRRFLATGLFIGAAALVGPVGVRARAGQRLAPTPAQPTGPFYPVSLPAEHDADLVRVAGAPEAAGQIVHLLGTVRDVEGATISRARVEIWQCDANGRYHHPGDRGAATTDPGFQGFGVATTDSAGAYRFRTIQPVPYPGRTPHIHVMVSGAGIRRLVTQLYVVGAPDNARDGLFARLDPSAQARLLVGFEPASGLEPGALAGRFDIVVERADS